MLISDYVEITCRPNNKIRLESQGYIWSYNKVIQVSVKDLLPTCGAVVSYLCDYCLDEHIKNYRKRHYNQYIKSRKNIQKDCCPSCQGKKNRDISLMKYGTANYMQYEEIKQKNINTRRTPLSKVIAEFEKHGLILLSEKFINGNLNLDFICKKHYELDIQDTTYANLKNGHGGCKQCGRERKIASQTGEKSHFWQGGITKLTQHLRTKLDSWKKDCLLASGFKCILTGENKDLEIHHLYSFNHILKKTLILLDLPVHGEIGTYSSLELKSIEELFLKLHSLYPLGIVLKGKLHKEFHEIYGKDYSTPTQFKEFLTNYNGKALRLKISDVNYYEKESERFFPYKKNCSSKYHGVCLVSSTRWQASIYFNRRNLTIGRYSSEYEAAEAYNKKAVELFGKHAKLNKLCEDEKPKNNEFDLMYYKFKKGTSSKYHGIKRSKYGFIATINNQNKRTYIGCYHTEVEAAFAYNEKAREIFGNKVKLNFLTDKETSFVKNKNCYYDHKTSADTIYSCVYFKSRINKWECSFYNKKKYYYLGIYDSDIEAAKGYNNFIKKVGLKRKLNKIT
ncbi:AP2 domain-containing protein [Bacillus sp. OK838]|nr:AP2 domain-containing protein [Bacillus sp. OK838]